MNYLYAHSPTPTHHHHHLSLHILYYYNYSPGTPEFVIKTHRRQHGQDSTTEKVFINVLHHTRPDEIQMAGIVV